MSLCSCGIWTWGHVIYDYRGFFKNMNSLGFDRITIWNDFAPVNADEIIKEAHSCGIKVVWGFSWGWGTDCVKIMGDMADGKKSELRSLVIDTFNSQYRDISADGIYFQSFTEHDNEYINGINVAEYVVDLVNSTAAELLSKNPELEIEFGLHATSVKHSLDKIAKTDKRIRIVWEDLGSFPFAYKASDNSGYDKTRDLVGKVLSLRGKDEKCGFIIKGMTQLDWSKFRHAESPLTIGESTAEFIMTRQKEKNPVWEKQTCGWKENLSLAKEIMSIISSSEGSVTAEALIEDGMFENEIKLPPIIFSELCADPERSTDRILDTSYSKLLAGYRKNNTQLSELTMDELWHLFPIQLADYNPEWANTYRETVSEIKNYLPEGTVFSHIGSTSVPGIKAKPIIDILAEIPVDELTLELCEKLTSHGWIIMSSQHDRISLNRGYTIGGFSDKVFHLHLRLPGDNDEIMFRNYLISHEDTAREYEKIKISLLEKYRYDRDGYTEAKTDFVRRVTQIAKESYGDINNE